MSPSEMQAWISIGTGIIAIGTFIYAFLTRGSKANADRLVNVEKAVGELITSNVDLKHRVDNYRQQMLTLPTKDDFHAVEMTVAGVAGDIKAMSGMMSQMSHKVDTIDGYLMDEKRSGR